MAFRPSLAQSYRKTSSPLLVRINKPPRQAGRAQPSRSARGRLATTSNPAGRENCLPCPAWIDRLACFPFHPSSPFSNRPPRASQQTRSLSRPALSGTLLPSLSIHPSMASAVYVAVSPLPAYAAASSPSRGPRHALALPLPLARGPRSPALRAVFGPDGNRRGLLGRGGSVVCAVQGQDTNIQVPDVTKATWQSLVTESELPVLVEFWASWCGPCKMIDPIVGKLSKEYEGKLNCYKLNTDENPDIASQYGVRSIPTMMMFKKGEKKDSVIGAVPESTLVICIEKFTER